MIDKKPAVGRYLCKESIWVTGGSHRGGIITKISGKRIYFTNTYGSKEHGHQWEEDEYVQKFAAICDTQEEFDMIQKHSKDALEEYMLMMRRHKEEFNALFTKENEDAKI